MRIPTSKLYRAFPELDRFSDAECRAFMARLRRQVGGQIVGYLIAGLCGFGVFVATIFVEAVMIDLTQRIRFSDDAELVLGAISFALPFLTGLMTILIVRDFFVRRTLRTRILNVVRRFTCRGCTYSLVGLRATGHVVRCPECGHETTFTELGIADDAALQLNAESSPSAAP